MSFASSSMIIGTGYECFKSINNYCNFSTLHNNYEQNHLIRNEYFDEKKKDRDARKAETKATTMYERKLFIYHLLVNEI